MINRVLCIISLLFLHINLQASDYINNATSIYDEYMNACYYCEDGAWMSYGETYICEPNKKSIGLVLLDRNEKCPEINTKRFFDIQKLNEIYYKKYIKEIIDIVKEEIFIKKSNPANLNSVLDELNNRKLRLLKIIDLEVKEAIK